jgi:hypothetical protein
MARVLVFMGTFLLLLPAAALLARTGARVYVR